MKAPSYVHLGGDRPLIGLPIYPYLRAVAERNPGGEAIVSIPQGARLTYATFFEQVDRLARGLLGLGVGKGDRVGIWATDNFEWVILQIAAARIGAILVNINPANRSSEFEHAMRAAKVGTLFLMPSFKSSRYVDMTLDLCPEARTLEPERLRCERLPDLTNLVLYDPDATEPSAVHRPGAGFRLWHEVQELGESVSDVRLTEREESIEFDDPINIQFTSGTTGFPKPVVLTHHNILNNAASVGEALSLTSKDKVCVPVPFYHCFGMVISNLGSLAHGATIVIPSAHFDAQAVLVAVDRERCSVLHGVPTMFVAELARDDFDDYDLSSLRTGIMAGAPCPPELLTQVIDRMGCREILIAYGQTEASPATHITRRTDSFERRSETVGTNMPHQEVKIIEPASGRVVPIGRPGEVCFRGYHVMKGYFEMPEATRDVVDSDGWLHSGDLGVIDEDGYLRITGRLKEMVIRGGENIYPAEIEAHLMTHPEVSQAAVFGVADETFGEELGAWVQLANGATATPDEIRDYVRAGMAHFKVPRFVRIVDDFPMTVTGKIQKFRIREIEEAKASFEEPVGA